MVGNGDYIKCFGLSDGVPLRLQTHLFKVPLYLLPIQGANVVLGMAWLCTLGVVLSNFSIPSISFTHQDHQITLTSKFPSIPSQMSHSQLHRALHTASLAQACTILCWPASTPHPSYWALSIPSPTESQPITLTQHSIGYLLNSHQSLECPTAFPR